MKKTSIGIALLFAGACFSASAQNISMPRPSPGQQVSQEFATSKIELNYSRPGVKSRNVFGDVVPFDQVWRTGANSATTIYFGEEVTINGVKVAAGKYGILSIPGKKEWQIIISRDTTVSSPAAYKQENDVVRIAAKPVALSTAVETFTIEVANVRNTAADIWIKWDKTAVSFTVTADIDTKIMGQIDEAMKAGGDKKPYFQAASYYYDNGKDLNKALEWATEAAKAQPDAFWVLHMKAKIQFKLKDYKGAIETAEQSKAKAEAGKKPGLCAHEQSTDC